jgi:hypothetical protein
MSDEQNRAILKLITRHFLLCLKSKKLFRPVR